MQDQLNALRLRLDQRDAALAAPHDLAALLELRREGDRLQAELQALREGCLAALQEAAATRHFTAALTPGAPRTPSVVDITF